ncbi:TPA: hypothetical protein NJ338_004493 [Vibrio parahaemolyticus]|nr:hypothetical protein [Vibrio parahaemolyticus]
MEPVKRLNPTPNTRRELFLLSRNECAFPGCSHRMIDENGHYIGKICHIEAANIGGERFNPNQTNEERRHFSNLVLMCGTHHDITNDVIRYSVSTMKKIKSDHESVSIRSDEQSLLTERFIDSSLSNSIEFPQNFGLLDLSYCDEKFFIEARKFIQSFSSLPVSTLSFYAHALNNSYFDPGNLSISFDPREMITRLGLQQHIIETHVGILQRSGLMSDLDSDESPFKVRYHFLGKDYDDYQIHFLCLLKGYCNDKPMLTLDIFENLNFIQIDR